MPLSMLTRALYKVNQSGTKMSELANSSLAGDIAAATGLNVEYNKNWMKTLIIGYTGDNIQWPDPNGDDKGARTGRHPDMIRIRGLENSTSSTICLSVEAGSNTTTGASISYTLAYTSFAPSEEPMLVCMTRGNKALVSIYANNPSSATNRIMGVLIDNDLRRMAIVASDGSSIHTLYQTGRFIGEASGSVSTDPQTIVSDVTPPGMVNDERFVSMAPLAIPMEAMILDEVFCPIFMRADQSSLQFDIGSDTFVSSGNPDSPNGPQFVVRFPPEVQSGGNSNA